MKNICENLTHKWMGNVVLWLEWNPLSSFYNLQIWSFFDILVQKLTQHFTLKRAPPSVETPFTMHACFLEFIAAALRVFLLAPFRWVCDYHKDCEGGEDEYDCRKWKDVEIQWLSDLWLSDSVTYCFLWLFSWFHNDCHCAYWCLWLIGSCDYLALVPWYSQNEIMPVSEVMKESANA